MLSVPQQPNKESHLTSNDKLGESFANSPGLKQNKYGDDPLITN